MIGFIALLASCFSSSAYAVKTTSSLDINYASANLVLKAIDATGAPNTTRAVESRAGFEIDYNVALFDYKTVASLSFTQFLNSTAVGPSPFSRVALGASYHFIRVNGQRVVLDNQVEAKVWGISPSVELSFGLTKLSINAGRELAFTSSLMDVMPRLNIEVPFSSNVLVLFKMGYYTTLGSSSTNYKILLSGSILEVGFKLTTL